MNKIGFQNFRRFQNFPALECGPLTFLVGRNNAGKSTLVKAYMLVNNYLTSGSILDFSIGENILEEVNIVTYGRALHQPQNGNFIRFFSSYFEFDIEITISGNEDDTKVHVTQLVIHDNINQIEYDFNWKILSVKRSLVKSPNEGDSSDLLRKIEGEILNHELKIEKIGIKKFSREYLELIDFINQLRSKREALLSEVNTESDSKPISGYSINVEIGFANSFEVLFDSFLSNALTTYKKGFDVVTNGKEMPENFESYRAFYEDQPIFESSIKRFLEVISNMKLVYLSANSSKQAALLFIRDKKNELAQSVHDYYTGLSAHNGFIKKWMKEFEVGEDFDVKSHAGEAYEVKIKNEGNWIQLADMGLGSIQAMQLIFRIANILDSDMYEKILIDSNQLVTVFIEEPELNLHPALQSKLADLFFEASDKYHVRFIIETHSEYILRRSQVIVAVNDLEIAPNENPFCVYYFPNENSQLPYRMKYQSDGVFDKNFGNGFFDAASSSTIELLRLKRQKQV